MKPIDIIILAVVAAVVGLVSWYLYRARKKGVKCIGCPEGVKCGERCQGCSGNCCGSAEK